MVPAIDIAPDSRILVVDLAYIGDLLMSTPAIANLRRTFPSATIDILVSPGSRPVIEHNPDLNSVLSTDMKKQGWKGIRDQAAELAGRGYSLAISFHRGHGTLMMLRMTGIPNRVGFTNGGRGLFTTRGIPFRIGRHRSWNHLRLLEEGLGIDVVYETPTSLTLDREALESVGKQLETVDRKRGLLAVNPNAAWATKRWLPEGFAAVIDFVSSEGFTPVLVGSPKEEQVAGQVRSRTRSDILDWTGRTTLQELSALLSMCTAIVTNDSGPMHVAQAVKIPVISIFGPTDPARCGPWLGEVEPLQVGLDCMKCYRKSCWHLSCMQQLKPDAVVERLSSCIGNIQ